MTSTKTAAAHLVGAVRGFLRPELVTDAHAAYAEGKLPQTELRAIEEQSILEVLRMQQEVGYQSSATASFAARAGPTISRSRWPKATFQDDRRSASSILRWAIVRSQLRPW